MNSLTIAQAAEKYSVKIAALYHAIASGQLECLPGLPRRVTPDAVEAWLATRRGPGKPPVGKITQLQAAAMLALSPSGVAYHIKRGNLPRALTARAVIEFALRRGQLTWGEWCAFPSSDNSKFCLGEIEYGLVFRYRRGEIGKIMKLMEQIAPLLEWRVVA